MTAVQPVTSVVSCRRGVARRAPVAAASASAASAVLRGNQHGSNKPTTADVSWRRSTGGRGLHSSTSQLNLSALYGIGGVRKGLCSPC
jgi:hypothetical protein